MGGSRRRTLIAHAHVGDHHRDSGHHLYLGQQQQQQQQCELRVGGVGSRRRRVVYGAACAAGAARRVVVAGQLLAAGAPGVPRVTWPTPRAPRLRWLPGGWNDCRGGGRGGLDQQRVGVGRGKPSTWARAREATTEPTSALFRFSCVDPAWTVASAGWGKDRGGALWSAEAGVGGSRRGV